MTDKHYVYGIHAVLSLLENPGHQANRLWLQNKLTHPDVEKIKSLAISLNIPCQEIAKNKLDKKVGPVNHQGAIIQIGHHKEWNENDLAEFLAPEKSTVLVLDGVQDPHNLGACLRTADAAGVKAIIIPKNGAVKKTDVVAKVASGAADSVAIIPVTNLVRTLKECKQHGAWVIGLDENAHTTIYQNTLQDKVVVVMGAEGKGLRELTKKTCDVLVSIPLHGQVSSLNVSVATGICLFEINRQRHSGNL